MSKEEAPIGTKAHSDAVFDSAAKLEAESERLRDLRDGVEPEPESEPGIEGEDVHRLAKARVSGLGA